MSGNVKKEFGDYQTPLDFCYRVCNYIKESRLAEDAAAIMEPTCGVGNFLLAASNTFACSKLIGIEVNAKRADAARIEVPSATIETNDIFNDIIYNLSVELGFVYNDFRTIFSTWEVEKLFEPDGIHLSPFAHKQLARKFVKILLENL